MRWATAALLLVLLGCGPSKDELSAKFWTTRDFRDGQGKNLDFGGWTPETLLVKEGAPLHFQEGAQRGGPGLTLFPGVADREVVAFAITEIWENYPQPWVQPVWVLRDSGGAPLPGVPNVFSVDVGSTFYSPFWKLEYLLTNDSQRGPYESARDVLASTAKRRPGPLVLCPIVPSDTTFADDGTGPKDPMTLRPLSGELPPLDQHLPPPVRKGWVDGLEIHYFDFGPHRAPIEGQNLIEAEAYFFVTELGQPPLPLAAVLPSEPLGHSLVRRVDVALPPGATPFVPSNRPELKRLLEERHLAIDLAPAALDAFTAYTLRVVTDPACFTDPAFPAACTWLDTEEAIDALPGYLVRDSRVQLAIGVVIP